MKVAVVGAGAIGAYVGAALHRAGADVHLIARGPHLAAMKQHGVQVLSPRGDFTARAHATDDPAAIGPVDYVFLGLKANSYAACGPLVASPARREHGGRRRPERHPLVVLPRARRPARGPPYRERGPRRRGQRGARRPSGPSAASSTRRPSSKGPVSYGTWRAPGSPSASRTAARSSAAGVQRGHAGGRPQVPGRARTSATTSGSSCSATSPSTRISALARATMAQICLPQRHPGAHRDDDARDPRRRRGPRLPPRHLRRTAAGRRRTRRRPPDLHPPGPGERQALELDVLLAAVVELAAITGTQVPKLCAIHAITDLLAQTVRSAA